MGFPGFEVQALKDTSGRRGRGGRARGTDVERVVGDQDDSFEHSSP